MTSLTLTGAVAEVEGTTLFEEGPAFCDAFGGRPILLVVGVGV